MLQQPTVENTRHVTHARAQAQSIMRIWLVTGATALLAMVFAGLLLRVAQTVPNLVPASIFYAGLTLHGSGMASVSLIVTAAVYWYLMQPLLPLSTLIMKLVYTITLLGLALIVIATFSGYGAGWTMLYPLPGTPGPGNTWNRWAAAAYTCGFGLVVGAFALWSGDFLRAGIARYGSLGALLGLNVLRGAKQPGHAVPPPSVIAGAVTAIDGIAAVPAGTVVVGLMLANLVDPTFVPNALLTKNLLFFSGHIIVNVQIYIGAGIAYALLPVYTGRTWKTSRLLVTGWLATLVLVMLASFHHLYQDAAQPVAAHLIGTLASYLSAFPPIVITIFGGLVLVYRSGMRWNVPPLFVYTAFVGWAIGGYAAFIDSSPAVNQYLHNTVWVPAYFHTFLALSVLFFMLGGVYHIMPEVTGQALRERTGKIAAACLIVGGWGLVAAWYVSGVLGQPRRYPFYVPHASLLTWIGLACTLIATFGAITIFTDFVRVIRSARKGRVDA